MLLMRAGNSGGVAALDHRLMGDKLSACKSLVETDACSGKRQALYTGPKSLQVKFQALKNAVKGQYGQDSAEAASVRGVKW